MSISISKATFDYNDRSWNVLFSKNMVHHRAKSENKIIEENYGSLNRAIANIGSNLDKYNIFTEEDRSLYRTLRITYKNALALFRKVATFDNKSKMEFFIESEAIPNSGYTCLPDKHSLAIHFHQTTNHGRSMQGINAKCCYPGNYMQACESILNLEVGEIMLTKESPDIFDLINTIQSVAEKIAHSLKNSKISYNTKERLSQMRLSATQNILQKRI